MNSASISQRMTVLLERIKDSKFLNNEGLGNEVPFYIFDFDPADELLVRRGIAGLHKSLADQGLVALEVNLFEIVLSLLEERKVLERALERERVQGSAALFAAVKDMVSAKKIRRLIAARLQTKFDVVFITGVGAAFPLVRSHAVLNNLHELFDAVPVVTFFPGEYDGMELRLFGLLKDDNYYRAFSIASRSGRSAA